tara:strand:+ start:171 stop:311 length:141 start_codon:yes stop_codon:yes gene_type:complete
MWLQWHREIAPRSAEELTELIGSGSEDGYPVVGCAELPVSALPIEF